MDEVTSNIRQALPPPAPRPPLPPNPNPPKPKLMEGSFCTHSSAAAPPRAWHIFHATSKDAVGVIKQRGFRMWGMM
jgi:hypothetical protein